MTQPELLGCRYWYEAYLQKSTMDGPIWDKSLLGITDHLGVLQKLQIVMTIDNNMVRYFFGANKDLTELSNVLEHLSLRPIDPRSIDLPTPTGREWLVNFVADGNLIDLRERTSVNRHRLLVAAVMSLRRVSLGAKVSCSIDLLFRGADGTVTSSSKRIFMLPGRLLAVNFRENEKYGYQKFSRHLDIKKALHILKSDPTNALLEVETYPYLPQNAYLDIASYDFDRHSFIVGASGSGKSKLIGLMVDRLLRASNASNYRVVVIDPHASLEHDLRAVPGANVVTFKGQSDDPQLFAEANTDISAATELTSSLFASLLGGQYTATVERVLRYSVTTLMTAQVMSLVNLKRFLTDTQYRQGVLEHVRGYIPETTQHYFAHDYDQVVATQYGAVVMPITELIDEIDLRAVGTSNTQANSLAHLVSAHPLTVFSLNKVSMGEKVIKTVSGLLIQQLFLLAQARQFNEKIILIIDEVSVIQNPTIAQILAEARKYNLFVVLTQQYFGQVEKPLQDAIFSNVTNYYVFKVSEVDARALEGNITMELPRKMMMEATRTIMNEEDKRVPILTSLDPRQCVVRVSAGGKILPAFKARTLDFQGQSSGELAASTTPLTQFTGAGLPKKYTEKFDDDARLTAAHKPQIAPEPADNLMQVLSRQSSHRNKRQGV